ncbi:Ger(x)C family spore germination protein [Neobacillus drentensis]|uniref:Ger(x)C family spore germination protein n=1 Tax=Neobacillus drentensis TaxID=220684 RepID=UPI002FFFEDD9
MRCSRLQKMISICILCFLCFFTVGCWNRKEIETLSFVIAVGIDPSESGYLVSTQVANTAALTKEGVKNAPNFFVYSTPGKTIFDAIRDATHNSPNKLFWSHTKVLIISEKTARKGLMPVLEFFARDAEERRNFLLVITPQQAKDIIKTDVKTTLIPSMTLHQLLEGYKVSSQTAYINLNDFLRDHHGTTCPLIPVVHLVKNQGGKQGFAVSKAAIIKGDKFISYLTPRETRGAFWVQEKVKSGILETRCLNQSTKDRIAFEIFKAESKIKAEKRYGKFVITVQIKEKGSIAEASCLKNEIYPIKIKEVEKLKKEAITKEIEVALEKAQKLNTDIFGFGEVIHRSYPKEWKKIEKNWDEIFPELQVNIKVESKITNNTLIQRKEQK